MRRGGGVRFTPCPPRRVVWAGTGGTPGTPRFPLRELDGGERGEGPPLAPLAPTSRKRLRDQRTRAADRGPARNRPYPPGPPAPGSAKACRQACLHRQASPSTSSLSHFFRRRGLSVPTGLSAPAPNRGGWVREEGRGRCGKLEVGTRIRCGRHDLTGRPAATQIQCQPAAAGPSCGRPAAAAAAPGPCRSAPPPPPCSRRRHAAAIRKGPPLRPPPRASRKPVPGRRAGRKRRRRETPAQ